MQRGPTLQRDAAATDHGRPIRRQSPAARLHRPGQRARGGPPADRSLGTRGDAAGHVVRRVGRAHASVADRRGASTRFGTASDGSSPGRAPSRARLGPSTQSSVPLRARCAELAARAPAVYRCGSELTYLGWYSQRRRGRRVIVEAWTARAGSAVVRCAFALKWRIQSEQGGRSLGVDACRSGEAQLPWDLGMRSRGAAAGSTAAPRLMPVG